MYEKEMCWACRFWVPDTWMRAEYIPSDKELIMGKCRKRAPSNEQGYFPEMQGNEWCGEWEPKKEAECMKSS